MRNRNDLAKKISEEDTKKSIAKGLAKDPRVMSLVRESLKDLEVGNVMSLEEVLP